MTTEIKEFNPFKLAWVQLQERVNSIKIYSFEDVESAKNILKECTELEKQIEDARTSITKPVNDMLKNINNMAKEIVLPVNEAKNEIKQKILAYNEEQERIKKAEEARIQKIVDWISKIRYVDLVEMAIKDLDEKDRNNFIIKTAIENQIFKINERKRIEAEEQKRKEEQAKLDEEKKKMSEEQAKLAEEKMQIEREKREIEEQKRKQEEEKALAEKQKIVDKIQNTETDKVKWIRTVSKWEIIDEKNVPYSLCSPDSKKINDMIKSWVKEIPWLRIREEKAIQ